MAETRPVAEPLPPAETPLAVVSQLASLRDQGGKCFDAAGWHYLESLARRAEQHDGTVRRLTLAKLEQAAGAFAERFAQARSAARVTLDTACMAHPRMATDLSHLFARGDFTGLRRMCASLDARRESEALAGLVSRLVPPSAVASAATPAVRVSTRIAAAPSNVELRTVRESRSTWARLSVDRQLARAMEQAPKNAGPINSHMLVLRSLAMMQAVSPGYLNHFVTYVDTLLSLDPGEKEVPVKRKKAAPGKSKSPKVPKK